jgi:hypothetical protein
VGQDLPPLPAACRPVMLPITSLVPSAAPHVQSPRQLPATFQQVLMVGPVLCEVTSISLVTEIVSQRDGRSSRRGTTCISPTGTFGSIGRIPVWLYRTRCVVARAVFTVANDWHATSCRHQITRYPSNGPTATPHAESLCLRLAITNPYSLFGE